MILKQFASISFASFNFEISMLPGGCFCHDKTLIFLTVACPKPTTVANATARQNHQKTRQKRDSKWSFICNNPRKNLSINILFLTI
jgi:hypothetical protein